MRKPVQISIVIFIVVSVLIIGSLNLIPFAQAEGSAPEKVPAPWIHEDHEYNVTGSSGPSNFTKEAWGISITHGGSMTALQVRNITSYGIPGVDYSNYITYNVGGKNYTAQFMISDGLQFEIWSGFGSDFIRPSLDTCADFTLNRSSIHYDGAVPTFDCNITFYGIRVYSVAPVPAGSSTSTFDFTLIHHIRGDWNNTQMKIEALFNFNKTKFFNSHDNNSEYAAGTPFSAEIGYRIYLAENTDGLSQPVWLAPSSRTNTTLVYNLTQNGTPLSVSRLDMKDDFTIHNATGNYASIAYSHMGIYYNPFTPVTHKFTNLSYKDTQWMRSDPKLTIYHDRITEENNQNPYQTGPSWLGGGTPILVTIIVVLSAITAGAIGAVVLLKKRKKKSEGIVGKRLKKE